METWAEDTRDMGWRHGLETTRDMEWRHGLETFVSTVLANTCCQYDTCRPYHTCCQYDTCCQYREQMKKRQSWKHHSKHFCPDCELGVERLKDWAGARIVWCKHPTSVISRRYLSTQANIYGHPTAISRGALRPYLAVDPGHSLGIYLGHASRCWYSRPRISVLVFEAMDLGVGIRSSPAHSAGV